MKYNPDIHHRDSIRLREFDYSQSGAYFITICTKERELWLDVPDIKKIVEERWIEIPDHFKNAALDSWVVMPNHIHGIISLMSRVGVQHVEPLQNRYQRIIPKSIGSIVRSYKSAVTNQCRKNGFRSFQWQRNYYERVIRSEDELNRIRQYIQNNPLNWNTDEENPNRED
ncbi:MAG TPA: transposase [Candidatus Manganitrophaceae bacterium]|nr:transposase [Candidatus Manganitrophaceae bacterium]